MRRDESRRVRREIDEELDFHFERTVAGLVDEGWDPEEARAEAVRRFGDRDRYADGLARIGRSRLRSDAWSRRLEGVRSALGLAAKGLVRRPWLSASVILILALGIGVNSAMFGMVDRILLRPPDHIESPDQVRRVYRRTSGPDGAPRIVSSFTYPDYLDFQEGNGIQVGAFSGHGEVRVGRGRDAFWAQSVLASASFLELTGVQARVGRLFTAEDDREGAPLTVVLGHELWVSRFGGDPGVVGTTVDLADTPYTVLGVAPEGFTGAGLERVDLWIPLIPGQTEINGTGWRTSRGWYWLRIVGRLAEGRGNEAVEAELTALHRSAHADEIAEGRFSPHAGIVLAGLIEARGPRPSPDAQVLPWLLAVSAIVLLIACANVAGLYIVRDLRRGRDSAVHIALGVTRGRLLASAFLESAFLAAAGALLGLLLAGMVMPGLHRLVGPDVHWGSGAGVRGTAFVALAAVFVALATGVGPAVMRTRTSTARLRSAGASLSRSSRLTLGGLLVGQAALSIVLLVGAGLFVRSLDRLASVDLGFEPDGLAYAQLEAAAVTESVQARLDLYLRVQEAVGRVPAVEGTALVTSTPFRNSRSDVIRIDGFDSLPTPASGGPYFNSVSPGFFEVMNIEVIEGRGFTTADRDGAEPVTVVSRSMANRLWPGGAVGECIELVGTREGCTRVIGVAEDQHRQGIVEEEQWFYYLPVLQGGRGEGINSMIFRASDVPSAAAGIRAALADRVPEVLMVRTTGYDVHLGPMLRPWQMAASMFTLFGGLALIVAGIGLYSLQALAVTLRRRELGVRTALGASGVQMVGMVVMDTLRLVGLGVSLGCAAALVLSDRLAPLLYEVSPRAPGVYLFAGLVFVLAGGIAAYGPARRASTSDPMSVLRTE